MRASKAERERHPPLSCWFCDQRHVLDTVLDNAILMSREPRDGGPYYLFACPFCHKENRVEETPRGRWFSSPQIQVGLMDYLFTWAPGLGRDELVLE